MNGEFFRLQEAEGFIAEQLDGETPLDVIQGRVEEKFGAKLEPETLAGFIESLDRQGLLETERSARPRRRKSQRRLAGGPLYLRFRLIDPDPVLDRLVHRLRFFFTPHFIFLSAGLILAAVAVWLFNWNEIIRDTSRLVRLSTLPLLVVTVFFTLTAHEFAHGMTCKYFGGQVREMGFLLLYFQPAFYCNVSDAWLFPEKSKRLWVGFAGPYFELFLWALATLCWRVTDADTWVNQASLVVMATSGVKTLFNFNPLIKLDGYYLLSDYLDIPNLRRKSFAYLGDFLKRVAGLTGRLPEMSRRERRIYLTYGLTAWVFSVSFLAYLGLMFGEYLIVEQERLAFLVLTGLIGFRLRDKFSRLFGRNPKDAESSGGWLKKSILDVFNLLRRSAGSRLAPFFRHWHARKTATGPSTASSATETDGFQQLINRWRQRLALLKPRALKLATAGGVLLLLLFAWPMELRVAGPINVLPYHNADVRTEIDGIVAEIHVDEGQRVRQGDLVARLSGREHRAELQKTEAEIQQVRARLDQLVAGPTKEEIEVARSAVTTAQDRLGFAQAKRTRIEALVKKQLVSQNDFDATRELEAAAGNELAEARSKLQVLLEGTRPEQIKAARAELSRLMAQQSYLEWLLERVDVRSPATGIVTTPGRQLIGMMHQAVPKGGLIAKVHELETITVEAIISEKEIADVKVGQTVGIKTRAYPDRVFYGKVIEIAPTTQGSPAASSDPSGSPVAGASGGADKTATAVRVTTEIDNGAGLLKPGMTGMAKIYCGKRRMIDLMTRRLSRTFRVEFWSWW